MRQHRRGSWTDTRRELGQLIWAVMLIDLIAIALGALAARSMGPEAFALGFLLAGFVTVVFAVLIIGNLAVEQLFSWWLTRKELRANKRPPV